MLSIFEARMDPLEHKLLAEMDRRFRVQTWSMITAMFAMVGLLGALLRLWRSLRSPDFRGRGRSSR